MGMLRLLLAVSVVLTHTGAAYSLAGGRIAVQLFYMISGFLISYVLHKDATYASTRRFYLARALRIFPPYYAVAAVVLVLFILERDRLRQFTELPAGLQAFMGAVNLTIFGQDWTSFMANPTGGLPLHKFLLVPQAWTLGLELSFYLLAPFIVRRRGVLVGLLCASLAARAWGWRLGLDHDPWSSLLPLRTGAVRRRRPFAPDRPSSGPAGRRVMAGRRRRSHPGARRRIDRPAAGRAGAFGSGLRAVLRRLALPVPLPAPPAVGRPPGRAFLSGLSDPLGGRDGGAGDRPPPGDAAAARLHRDRRRRLARRGDRP